MKKSCLSGRLFLCGFLYFYTFFSSFEGYFFYLRTTFEVHEKNQKLHKKIAILLSPRIKKSYIRTGFENSGDD